MTYCCFPKTSSCLLIFQCWSVFNESTNEPSLNGRLIQPLPDTVSQPSSSCLPETTPENISDSFAKIWHQIGMENPVRWMNKTDDIESVFQSAYQICTFWSDLARLGRIVTLRYVFDNVTLKFGSTLNYIFTEGLQRLQIKR